MIRGDIMNQYTILFYDEKYCLVALNTVYNIGEVMKDFVNSEIKNSNYNGIVIFDSLLSSISYNDSNRFFCYKSNCGVIDYSKRIMGFEIPNKYIKKSNNYFENNEKLMKNSFLLDFF